jgi:hypothetical protein
MEVSALAGTIAKPKKRSLQAKPLPSLRTTSSVKGPGNLSSLKPLASLNKRKRDNDQ